MGSFTPKKPSPDTLAAAPDNVTPAPAIAAEQSSHAGDSLERAAWIVLAAMPLALAFAVRSSAALIGLAAVLALAGIFASGRLRELAATTWRNVFNLPGALLPLFAALAAASLLWHPFPRQGLFAMGEAFGPLVAAALLGMALGRLDRRLMFTVFASLFALASLEVLVEFLTGMAWREMLGARTALFVLNKPVICLVVLFWPLLSLSEGTRRRGLVMAALAVLMAAAVFKSVSGAAMLALAAAACTFGLALVVPRLTWALVMLGLFTGLALAPFKGQIAHQFIPDRVLDRMQSVHARDRVEIWQSFGEVVEFHPFAGVGFGVSPRMGDAPVAALVPQEHKTLLAVGHPHDMFLQIWSELGALGALLAAIGLAWLGRALLGLRPSQAAPVLASLTAILVIAQVGHGAWQGWWIAILGAAAIWFCKSFETASPAANGPARQAVTRVKQQELSR